MSFFKLVVAGTLFCFSFVELKAMNDKKSHFLPIINSPSRPYLNWLTSGIKKAEGRINGPACKKMKVGHLITLEDKKRKEYILARITFKHEYKSFEAMLSEEGVSNMLPFLKDDQLMDGVRVYRSFPGANRIRELGCVAIGMVVLESHLSEQRANTNASKIQQSAVMSPKTDGHNADSK